MVEGPEAASTIKKQRAINAVLNSFFFSVLYSTGSQPREWCYPQWLGLPISINLIKITPTHTCLEAHIPGNSRRHQVDY